MGNGAVYSRLSGRRNAELAHLFSRVGMGLQLRRTSAADVEALARQWGVKEKPAFDFLIKIGSTHGALREVHKTSKLADLSAQGEGEPLDLNHLKSAYAERVGEDQWAT